MRRHGHPILGAIAGFFFGLFLGLDLMLFGTIRTYSNLITILPLAGIVVGFLWGWWSPFRRSKTVTPPAPSLGPTTEAPPATPTVEPTHTASPTRTTDGNEPPPLS